MSSHLVATAGVQVTESYIWTSQSIYFEWRLFARSSDTLIEIGIMIEHRSSKRSGMTRKSYHLETFGYLTYHICCISRSHQSTFSSLMSSHFYTTTTNPCWSQRNNASRIKTVITKRKRHWCYIEPHKPCLLHTTARYCLPHRGWGPPPTEMQIGHLSACPPSHPLLSALALASPCSYPAWFHCLPHSWHWQLVTVFLPPTSTSRIIGNDFPTDGTYIPSWAFCQGAHYGQQFLHLAKWQLWFCRNQYSQGSIFYTCVNSHTTGPFCVAQVARLK